MQIALVPSSFAPSIGGVEDLTRQLAVELAKRDSVEVWTSASSAPEGPAHDEIDGLSVRRFAFPLPPARVGPVLSFPAGARRTMQQLEAAFTEFRPDVVHVVCFAPNGAYATELCRRHKVPLVVTLQGETVMDDGDIYDKSMLLRAALRRGLRRADVITACSRFTLDDARRFGLPEDRSQVIFNGTTLEETAVEPIETPFARYVLCLGRVVEKKGFDLMMAAFPKVAEKLPDVGLVIAGGGPALDALRAQAATLGIGERVYFSGPLGRSAVAGAMHDAEVFVMPSRLEPFGIVALEGWRGGTPIVVSSRGGAPEFVRDGIEGLVVDPFDADALANAVLRLLVEPGLASALTAAATERLQEFTWPHIAEHYRDVYASACAPSPAGQDLS